MMKVILAPKTGGLRPKVEIIRELPMEPIYKPEVLASYISALMAAERWLREETLGD